MNNWHVVVAKPNLEATALANLIEQGYDAFLPLCLAERHHNHQKSIVRAPLFPRYLFVAFDHRADWAPILHTRGVLELLRAPAGYPHPINPEIIASIKARMEMDGGAVRLEAAPEAARPLEIGDRIHVTGGPLAGHGGIFQQDVRSRLVILIDTIGRPVRTSVPRDLVRFGEYPPAVR